MATNPMQRKTRNSFLLGMVLSLLITVAVAALLIFQIKNLNEEIETQKSTLRSVYVLSQDVKSGQLLTSDMFNIKQVSASGVPSNATGDIETTLSSYKLCDTSNHPISIKIDESKEASRYYYVRINNADYTLYTTDEQGSETVATNLTTDDKAYYYTNNNKSGQKVEIEIISNAVVAKVDIKANTVITGSLITRADTVNTADVRIQEYNMVVLPSDLFEGDYIDIRLMLPTGQDFIVVSKKEVKMPTSSDGYISDTICINLAEEEILSMSSAIVEAFRMNGSKLYATKYAEAGTQKAATPTYPVNREVAAAIETNPNILTEALNGLKARYNASIRNDYINSAMSSYGNSEEYPQKMQESITATKEAREKYLQSLSGGTE